MRPRYVEQGMFAHRVEAMGAGAMIDARADAKTVTTHLQSTLYRPDYRQAAQAFRVRYQQFLPEQAVEHALALIEQEIVVGRRTLVARHTQQPQKASPVCLH